jgi:hypothetical protein
MIETIKGVRNPLTIIAIFAGLAEISGTGILPFIAQPNQATYIWFLMIFPVILVGLFFVTLNFNPKVLYSPSDFRDEENYMRIFQPASIAQKALKIRDELADTAEREALPTEPQPVSEPRLFTSRQQVSEIMKQDSRARYELAEELIIDRLSREFRSQPRRDMSLRNKRNGFMFDAVFERPNGLTIVEVKFHTPNFLRLRDTLNQIQTSIQSLPENLRRSTTVILAIAHDDMKEDKVFAAKRQLESMTAAFPLPIEIRMFALSDLLKELE